MKLVRFAMVVTGLPMALLIACGGAGKDSSSPLLHFTGRDETEANFTQRIRESFASNPLGLSLVCRQISGLPLSEAVPLVKANPGPDQVFPGSTPRPGQQADDRSLERATKILQDECKRMKLG